MATEAPAFKFDKAVINAHLDAVEKEVLAFQGKKGCNPFLWIRDNITPVRNKLAAKDFAGLDKASNDAVLALKCPYVAPSGSEVKK